jgi:hypothetical protein
MTEVERIAEMPVIREYSFKRDIWNLALVANVHRGHSCGQPWALRTFATNSGFKLSRMQHICTRWVSLFTIPIAAQGTQTSVYLERSGMGGDIFLLSFVSHPGIQACGSCDGLMAYLFCRVASTANTVEKSNARMAKPVTNTTMCIAALRLCLYQIGLAAPTHFATADCCCPAAAARACP